MAVGTGVHQDAASICRQVLVVAILGLAYSTGLTYPRTDSAKRKRIPIA